MRLPWLSAGLLLALLGLSVPSYSEEAIDVAIDEGDAHEGPKRTPHGVPNILPVPPEGTRVQSELELNGGLRVGSVMIGGGPGGKIKIQVDERMRYPGSFQKEEFVNLTIESKIYLFVEPEIEIAHITHGKLPFKVGGKRMTGFKVKFIAHMPVEYYERDEIPNIFDPETMPVGTSILLKEEDMEQLDTEGSYRLLAYEDEHQTTHGNAIGVERLADDKLRLIAGPTEGVSENLKLFAGLDHEFHTGPIRVKAKVGAGIASYKALSIYQLRTAIVDPSTDEGKAALMRFVFADLGRVLGPGDGVVKTGTIQRLTYLHDTSVFVKASADFEARLPKFDVAGHKVDPHLKVKVGGEAGMNFSVYAQSSKHARYDDGTREVEETIRHNDRLLSLKASLDERGQVEYDEEGYRKQKFYVILMRLDEGSASYVHQALTEQQRKMSGRNDVQLKFTGEEALALRQRAKNHVEAGYARCGYQCDPMPGTLIYNLNLSEPDPAQVALAFTRATSNGNIAENLLLLYVDTYDKKTQRGSPIEGAIEMVASSK